MPRKKLTKTQARKAQERIMTNMVRLLDDRLQYGTKSFVALSYNKMADFVIALQKSKDKIF